jgi:hypothetical protein
LGAIQLIGVAIVVFLALLAGAALAALVDSFFVGVVISVVIVGVAGVICILTVSLLLLNLICFLFNIISLLDSDSYFFISIGLINQNATSLSIRLKRFRIIYLFIHLNYNF